MTGPVKVKRDGPRGWHWIAAENYDPAVHELASDAPAQPEAPAEPVAEQADEAPAPAPKPRRAKRGKRKG